MWVRQVRDATGAVVGVREVNLGGKAAVSAAAGDRIVIQTPGGGGYGAPTETHVTAPRTHAADKIVGTGLLSLWSSAQLSG